MQVREEIALAFTSLRSVDLSVQQLLVGRLVHRLEHAERHRILKQTNVADAIGALVYPTRALSASYLIGDAPGQTIAIETSAVHTYGLAPQAGIITHTHHCEGSRLRRRDLSRERFPHSLYRSCRLRDRLSENIGELTRGQRLLRV